MRDIKIQMLDLDAVKEIELLVAGDGRVWVNVDGVCIMRSRSVQSVRFKDSSTDAVVRSLNAKALADAQEEVAIQAKQYVAGHDVGVDLRRAVKEWDAASEAFIQSERDAATRQG